MTQANTKNLMTEGVIWKKILFFALPIFFGNLFQQLYNTADSLIVGNFLGSEALAAVSSSGNLIFLLVGFFNGIAVGAGVVIARYYGARNSEQVQLAAHTTVAFGLAASVLLTAIGVLLAPQILIWMGTPLEVLGLSTEYFRIYFAGSLGFIMYNIFVGILQAAGDSRHPLIYLVISSLINIVLDLIFVAGLHLGVGSAAFATIVSQLVSAALCWRRLLKVQDVYRIEPKKIRFNKPMLKLIIQYGLPSGLQNSIIGFANVVVQANINAFGQMAMAGCGAFSKIEGFGFLPITSFTTFVGQNLGAREFERTRKGARFGILCSMAIAEVIGILIYVGAPWLIAAFNRDPQVIAYGTDRARTSALFFFLLAFSHCIAGIMRGAGKATVPMLVMLLTWCAARVTFITLVVKLVNSIQVVFWAYPLTWLMSSVIFFYYYRKVDWMHAFDNQ